MLKFLKESTTLQPIFTHSRPRFTFTTLGDIFVIASATLWFTEKWNFLNSSPLLHGVFYRYYYTCLLLRLYNTFYHVFSFIMSNVQYPPPKVYFFQTMSDLFLLVRNYVLVFPVDSCIYFVKKNRYEERH